MLLKFGTTCRSRGEALGTLVGLSVEPAEKLLLKVVVEEMQADPLVRVRIAFGRVDHADGDQVVLGMAPEEFRGLRALETGAGTRRGGGGGGGGSSTTRRRRGDDAAEVLLTARTRVSCRDGEAGNLGAIVVDARSGDLESIVVPIGMPMTRDVVIAADQVAEIQDDAIVLKCDLNDLAACASLRA